MDILMQKLYNLLEDDLYLSCPVLSGNMRHHIDMNTILPSDQEVEIVISAPFYDQKEWEKNHKIVFTGEIIHGKHDYAQWVNDLGPFGRAGRSQHWVNRTCYEVCSAIANEIGAEVICEVNLR